MKALIFASIVINIVLVFCTVDDFLALHDINADYVSTSALTYLRVETSAPLPTWTETTLEWTSVAISYALRSILIISNLGILLLLRKRLARGNEQAQASA